MRKLKKNIPPVSMVEPSASVLAVQYRGRPLLLMKFLDRLPCSVSASGGMPSSSMMHAIWSASSSPGSRGKPAIETTRQLAWVKQRKY